jgi:cell division protein FtsB
VLLVVALLIGVVGFEMADVFRQITAASAEEQALKQQLQQQQLANAALKEDLSRADDLEFIKELARDQLGMAEQGERIFYDVND